MMRIELDITKTVQQNAERYFESSKKAKRKAHGAREAVERMSTEGVRERDTPTPRAHQAAKRWFMEYRWHVTETGVLCVGGRSAETNERLVKKYTNKNDRIFHTDVQGSPFYIARTRGKELSNEERQGIVNACASFSRAWKYGLTTVEVFEVGPEQVSKRARAGEYISTGSFMVYGERTYHNGALELFATLVSIDDDSRIMVSGERLEESFARIIPGRISPSQAARELAQRTGVAISEIERALPPGPVQVDVLNEPKTRVIGRVE